MNNGHERDGSRTPAGNDHWLNLVREQVASIQFGVVQIVVHDSRVVQVEKTEKIRLDSTGPHRGLPCPV